MRCVMRRSQPASTSPTPAWPRRIRHRSPSTLPFPRISSFDSWVSIARPDHSEAPGDLAIRCRRSFPFSIFCFACHFPRPTSGFFPLTPFLVTLTGKQGGGGIPLTNATQTRKDHHDRPALRPNPVPLLFPQRTPLSPGRLVRTSQFLCHPRPQNLGT